jgi:hypothetical protein
VVVVSRSHNSQLDFRFNNQTRKMAWRRFNEQQHIISNLDVSESLRLLGQGEFLTDYDPQFGEQRK